MAGFLRYRAMAAEVLSNACQTEPFWSKPVRNQRHFENPRRDAYQIRTVIADLDRTIQLLNCDIGMREEDAGTNDPADLAYPATARAMAVRRDNLEITVAALERRLADRLLQVENVAVEAK